MRRAKKLVKLSYREICHFMGFTVGKGLNGRFALRFIFWQIILRTIKNQIIGRS